MQATGWKSINLQPLSGQDIMLRMIHGIAKSVDDITMRGLANVKKICLER